MFNEHILNAWEKLRMLPFPDPPESVALVEIRAELANISTFGSGCFHSFLQKGGLGTVHHTVLLNCLTALQRVEGKLTLVNRNHGNGASQELEELLAYKEALERFFEAIHINCQSEEGGNGSSS
jgi:hypothetical protein